MIILFAFNVSAQNVFNPVIIDEYKDFSEPIAAKRLTDKMEQVLNSAGDDYYANYSGKSRNNY